MKVGRTQCHKRFLGSFRLHIPNTSGLRDTWSAQTGEMKSFKEDEKLRKGGFEKSRLSSSFGRVDGWTKESVRHPVAKWEKKT